MKTRYKHGGRYRKSYQGGGNVPQYNPYSNPQASRGAAISNPTYFRGQATQSSDPYMDQYRAQTQAFRNRGF